MTSSILIIGIIVATGLAVAYWAWWYLRQDQEVEMPPVSEDTLDDVLETARIHVENYELKQARSLLHAAHAQFPSNYEVTEVLYSAWKYAPRAPEFHHAAHDYMNRPGDDVETDKAIYEIYLDYLAVTQGQPKLPEDFHLTLARRFARSGKVDEGARIVNRIMRENYHQFAVPGTLLEVAKAYLALGKPNKARPHLENILALFPDAAQKPQAEELLSRIT